MDRKFFYFLTIVLFGFPHLSAALADDAAKMEFPINGGTTSDGIEITDVQCNGFEESSNGNGFFIENSSEPSFSFNVTVPEGKDACLRYKVFLTLTSTEEGERVPEGGNVSFCVKVDDNRVIYHYDPVSICYQSDEVVIPSGSHNILIEASLSGDDCNTSGYFNDLSIHLHQFGQLKVMSEPICGMVGTSSGKCQICGKDSTLTVAPPYEEHSWKPIDKTTKSSCMMGSDMIYECEHCPKTEIHRNGGMEEHDFDENGRCRNCELRIPEMNADTTVFTVRNAAEMRILAELVSIGKIPGNIGVDIQADLVYTKELPMLPLGTADHPFQGVLNGNGHRIQGVVNTFQGIDCLGFVGVAKGTMLSHAVIANLIFDKGNNMKGTACVGGIVGYASYCDIVNCANFGALDGNDYVGGLVGYADQQVSIINSAAVTNIKTEGTWNTMACGMPSGHILNSYGVVTNEYGGTFDELETTTLRHCFSSQGSGNGLTQVSQAMLSSVGMVQLLNEECETPAFMMSETYRSPIPVANSEVVAKPNKAIARRRRPIQLRRAPSVGDTADLVPEKEKVEIETINGYVNEAALRKLGRTVEEIMSEDSVQYANFNRIYITSRTVPEGFGMYERISGGEMKGFESWLVPADSSYLAITEYRINSSNRVKPQTQTVLYESGENQRIDLYNIDNGAYTLASRISFADVDNIVYMENNGGIMTPVWSIVTDYNRETGKPAVTNVLSYNNTTGETYLEYSSEYDSNGHNPDLDEDPYEEYLDSLNNAIHITYYHTDSKGVITSNEHYIIRASDHYLMEVRTEKYVGGGLYPTDGIYFLYSDKGDIQQSVVYGLVNEYNVYKGVCPKMYYDYIGAWQANPYPTAIKVPTVEQPSIRKRLDHNVYDMRGRVVRKVTDEKDPFNGLPRGLYIYQGAKYIKQ